MNAIMLGLIGAAATAIVAEGSRFALEALKKRKSRSLSLAVKKCADVIAWGWSGERLLKRLVELDYKLLGDILDKSREGTPKQWAPVFMENPHTWVLITKGDRNIVGYWHFAPLSDKLYAKVKSGELLDSEVIASEIQPLDIPGFYNIYFTMIGHNNIHLALHNLIDAFYKTMEDLATRGVFFRELSANALTENGARLCIGFGMKKAADHVDIGEVYSTPLDPWPKKLDIARLSNLKSMYAKAFKEARSAS
jgi:hypothetical protein